jgi:exosortase
MTTSGLLKEGWRPTHLVLAVLLAAGALAATWGAWADMYLIARNDEECGHALLALPAFVWLFWIRRGRLRRCEPTGQWFGVVLIATGWATWSWGFRHQNQPIWHFGALLMVLGAFLTGVGSQIFWEFLAAFAVLVFLVPVPSTLRERIAQPLQVYIAQATQLVCEAFGMDVDRTNSLLTVNGTRVAIAEACNGMRMVFSLILVCYLFAFVNPLRGYVRVMLLVISPLVALLFNIIRLVPTVWVFGHFSQEAAENFHDISGWVMLILAFLTMVGFLKVMRWAMVPVTHFRLVDVT